MDGCKHIDATATRNIDFQNLPNLLPFGLEDVPALAVIKLFHACPFVAGAEVRSENGDKLVGSVDTKRAHIVRAFAGLNLLKHQKQTGISAVKLDAGDIQAETAFVHIKEVSSGQLRHCGGFAKTFNSGNCGNNAARFLHFTPDYHCQPPVEMPLF